MHDSDDQNLFAEAMGAVNPLHSNDKVHIEQNRTKIKQQINAIQRTRHTIDTVISTSQRTQSVQNEPWTLVANGVSRDTLKRLTAGRPSIGLSVDLHGMTRDEALTRLQQGIEQALQEELRVLCIVHGRGLHSQGKPVLKQAVYRWLEEGSLAHIILAAIPQPHSGGGACLVLLRRQHKQ